MLRFLLEQSKAICYESFADVILWQRQKIESPYSEQISAEVSLQSRQIFKICQVHWQVELFNKAQNSGNDLKSINSSKKCNSHINSVFTASVSQHDNTWCKHYTETLHCKPIILERAKYNTLFAMFHDAIAYKGRGRQI